MRKVLAVTLSVVAILGLLVPDASAQAPAAAKVTISGFMDSVSSYTKNLGIVDLNPSATGDSEWYARTRVRPDVTAEVGTTKFVLGLEIDYTWGQTGAADVTPVGGATGPQRFGTTSGADLNTDLLGNIELKWAYTEFGLPGIPWASRVRLGAQPWAATYKTAVLATGDFGGAHVTTTVTPIIKLNATWAQVEEESTGTRDGFPRGEDFAFIGSIEVTPFKGLDIRPLYSLFKSDGVTSGGQARLGRGGVSNSAVFFPSNQEQEYRHTFGFDARWRGGPFSFEPTIFYQLGTRDMADTRPLLGSGGYRGAEQWMNAWFVDLRGGFQTGPLLLEAAVIYTSGNRAQDDVRNPETKVNFYQPISTDSSYYAAWAEHFALNIDYFNMMNYAAGGLAPGVGIGYDKYGMMRLGARASYNVTPAFTVRGAVSANWTAQEVDTDGVKTAAAGITPGDFRGDDRYLGTEIDAGFQWRFAPGLAFDMVGAYTFSGPALGAATAIGTNGVARPDRDPEDMKSITARVRFSF